MRKFDYHFYKREVYQLCAVWFAIGTLCTATLFLYLFKG
jgi:hypothetical protein